MFKTKIISTGSYLPIQRVSTQDILEEVNSEGRFGIKTTIMEKLLGIKEMRWADSQVEPSDLAVKAAEIAIQRSGIDRSNIDLLIFCGITRDFEEPSTAHNVHRKLGLVPCPVFDESNACHGFIDGMITAESRIKIGRAKLALVVTGETSSRMSRSLIRKVQGDRFMSAEYFKTQWGHFSLADGAGAAIIGINEESEGDFGYFNNRCDGNYVGICNYRYQDDGEFVGAMIMNEMSHCFEKFNAEIMEDTYKKLNWTPQDVDYLISHQIGRKPHLDILRLSGVDAHKAPTSFERCGNLTSATIPYNLDRIDLASPGKKVLMFGAGSGATITQGGIIT